MRSNGRCEGGERRIREGEGRGKNIFHFFGRDFIQEWRKGDFGETLGESELTVVWDLPCTSWLRGLGTEG